VTQSVGRAAVQGLGGVGKTSLAAEYAHRYRQLYAGVRWCPAETRTGLLSSLANLAVTLGVARADEADVEKAAKAALRRLTEQHAAWLLVYDNVTSPDEISALLPSSGARVLITSRFPDWSQWADEVSLDVLPLGEAVSFLQSRSSRQDAAGAQTLAEALGSLPLALDHAAAYCKRTQMSFADYAVRASSLITVLPRAVGYPRSVAATFDLCLSQAVEQCPVAELVLSLLAQCAPERIPIMLLDSAVEDELELREAVAALVEVSLLKHDPFEDGTPAVIVHRLVQAVARGRAQTKMTAQASIERLIEWLLAIYPSDGYDNPQSWTLCAKLTPHVLQLQSSAVESAPLAALLNRAGNYYHGRGSSVRAAKIISDSGKRTWPSSSRHGDQSQ
jgi:NB-ARC domain